MARRKRDQWDGVERRVPAMVLVAGEDAGANELLSRLLNSRGYRTVVARSAEAAMTLALEQLPRAAVVDLAGGGIGTNLQLLDWFRSNDDERLKRCRVIVVAASRANRSFSLQSGADDFLVRPFHVDELLEAIESSLATSFEDLPQRRRDLLRRAETST